MLIVDIVSMGRYYFFLFQTFPDPHIHKHSQLTHTVPEVMVSVADETKAEADFV